MNILFEDEDIIVCVKPCGVLSQADAKGGESMISLLSAHTNSEVFPLHRLDREVGGVMVFAKTKIAAAILSRDIQEHKFKKEYYALVHGTPDIPFGELRDLLFKDSQKNKTYVVNRERKGVKEAVLDYKIVNEVKVGEEPFTVVSIKLRTGRTHQIRVQFSSRNMPLAGDKKYGAKDDFKTIGLWSHCIEFTHPRTKEKLCFVSAPENIIKDYI